MEPVRNSRGDSRGVVVVLSGRRGALTEAHVEALGAYGAFVGLAIALTAETNELVESPAVADARITR